MSSTPSHLQRNEYGIYWFRIAIPKDLRLHLGKREIRRTLRTGERAKATCIARIMSGQAKLLFKRIREMSKDKFNLRCYHFHNNSDYVSNG